MKKLFLPLLVCSLLFVVTIPSVNAATKSISNVQISRIAWDTYDDVITRTTTGSYPALYTSSTSGRSLVFRFVASDAGEASSWYTITEGNTFNVTNPSVLKNSYIIELHIAPTTYSSTTTSYSGVWLY